MKHLFICHNSTLATIYQTTVYVKTKNSVNSLEQTFVHAVLNKPGKIAFKSTQSKEKGSVGAAGKVSPNWSQETMTCHSSNCFGIAWGQGNAPLVIGSISAVSRVSSFSQTAAGNRAYIGDFSSEQLLHDLKKRVR